MEFDKKKILTCVTDGTEWIGKKGWFAYSIVELRIKVGECSPHTLQAFDSSSVYPFKTEDGYTYTLFYPAPEPTYRPYNNDELNDLVGEVLTNKQSGRRKLVTGKPSASEGVNLDGSYINAKDLLTSFYRNGDKPCGVEEDIC